MSTDLLKQIDDLVSSKTFNLDALDGIKAIKDSLRANIESKEALEKRYKTLFDENERNKEAIERLSELANERLKQIDVLKGGELKAKEAVWEKLIAEAKAGAYQDALYTVFKPSAVRETIQRNVAVPVEGHPGGNGYSPTGGYVSNASESETITKEQL